jgi:hypothetical protein
MKDQHRNTRLKLTRYTLGTRAGVLLGVAAALAIALARAAEAEAESVSV